ncbi:MAG: glycine--tRNA ligase subunit beta [Candidatus Aminicenantes bacterium]|nr:glycine--tRNA ligase subunit beta [Candidatus Aminicenantes bacterium]
MEFLLEIQTEELPPSHVRSAVEDLRDRFRKELAAAQIAAESLRLYSTCRRLTVLAEIPAGQPDRDMIVTGPPKANAYAADGSPTPAALGFARAKGVAVEALKVFTTDKGEYIGVRTAVRGKPASEILPGIIARLISSLTFPRMMRWGTGTFKFSRPLRGLLCLLGGKPLPFVFEGLTAGNWTAGHMLRSPEPFQVDSFASYRDGLRARGVVLDGEERKAAILAQIEARLAPLGAALHPDPALLDKLASDVECPFVIMGSFPEDYLQLPLEILSTAMREGQKLFSVVKGRKQLPLFLGVADTDADPKGFIQKGHERVLKARLADARFFWEQDRKTPLRKRAAGLKAVLFQEKLGSYEDKAQRLKKLVVYLCDKAGAKALAKDAATAAELCKADLLTDMVREFPALQGIVGGLYARAEGLPEDVARAIAEHYQPGSLEDDVPASLGGALLSLADKIDSIVGVVGIGIQTSGSSDPFGLRRNAQGVCKIILERKLNLPLPRLLDKAVNSYGDRLKQAPDEIRSTLMEFFAGRLRSIFERQGYRYDLINAALGAGVENILHASLRLKALDGLKSGREFEPFILMAKRINNIAGGQPAAPINAALLQEKAEKELYAAFVIVRDNTAPMLAKGDYVQAQKMAFRLQPLLDAFFTKVLVMAEEAKLRRARIGLLQGIKKILDPMADYSQVVVEGEKGKPTA